MSVNPNDNDSPYYSQLDGGYTVYQGTPDLNERAGLQQPGRGKEFSTFTPQPLQQDKMKPSDKAQRYAVDPRSQGPAEFQTSFDDSGRPMPGAKSGNPDKGIVHLLSVYADKCSLNGIIFIKSSKYYIVKLIWALLLLIALGVMIWHLYELTTKFYAFEKQSKVELQFAKLNFPAVTFCNVNAMKMSKSHLASDKLQGLIDNVDPDYMFDEVDGWEPEYDEDTYHYDESGDFIGEDDDYKRRKKRSTTSTTSQSASNFTVKSRSNNFFDDFNFTDWDDTYVDEYSGDTFSGSWEAESEPAAFDKINRQFINLYNKENGTTRQQMGHRIQDMLVQCSFSGRKCVQKNFTLVASSTMGNCYTIQYNKFVSRQSGPREGLSLILFLETDDYVPGITNAIGAKLVVHEPDTIPFPDDEGMAISAGMETNIGLKRVSIKRLDEPFGECTDTNTFKTTYGIKYTRQACQEICEMEQIAAYCNCYDSTKPIIYTLLKNRVGVPSCQKKKDNVWCMEDIRWSFQTNSSTCHCESPCSEITYQKTISTKVWPAKSFAKLIAKTVCKEKTGGDICNYMNMTPLELRENFVKVNVFFETLNYESYSEEEDYSLFQFVSDIGGTVGLYVGLSVLSMFEIFHLLISVLRYVCCGNWQKHG